MTQFSGADLTALVLRGPRVTVRPWRPDDAVPVRTIMTDDELRFALHLSDDEALIGGAAVHLPPGGHAASIGYWLAPTAQGHGYATEAAQLLARWSVDHGRHRVEIETDVGDLAAARVALRAGFGFESVRRDARSTDSGLRDTAVFVRTSDDPDRAVPPLFPPLPGGSLTDGTVALRAMVPDDLEAFAEQESDALTRQVGFTGRTPPRRAMEHLLARAALDLLVGPAAGFTMVDVASGAYAGSIRLRLSGPPNVGGVGYVLHPAFRGRGYTSRALRLLSAWAFDLAGFARLELGAKVDNVASQRAALSAGFVADGTWRARLRNEDGTFSDEARFCLVNPRYS